MQQRHQWLRIVQQIHSEHGCFRDDPGPGRVHALRLAGLVPHGAAPAGVAAGIQGRAPDADAPPARHGRISDPRCGRLREQQLPALRHAREQHEALAGASQRPVVRSAVRERGPGHRTRVRLRDGAGRPGEERARRRGARALAPAQSPAAARVRHELHGHVPQPAPPRRRGRRGPARRDHGGRRDHRRQPPASPLPLERPLQRHREGRARAPPASIPPRTPGPPRRSSCASGSRTPWRSAERP